MSRETVTTPRHPGSPGERNRADRMLTLLPVAGTLLTGLPVAVGLLTCFVPDDSVQFDNRWWLGAVLGIQCYILALILIKRKPSWTGADRNAFYFSLSMLLLIAVYGLILACVLVPVLFWASTLPRP